LAERHRAVARALGDGDLVARLDAHLRELRVLLRGVRLLGTATPRSSDQVLGFGELLAQELLAVALANAGGAARVVDSREVVITDDNFGEARCDLDATRERCAAQVAPLVAAGVVPVLGGYLGGTRDGIPTTLGRGGSDLSASLLGLAMNAAAVEIWTDVDGLMTADPRLVPGARVLDRITFREAAELAGFGAKVLHPASIDPAIQGGLPVLVRNSLDPSRPGTLIGTAAAAGPPVRAIAARGGLCLVALRAPGRLRDPAFLPQVLGRFAARGLETVAVMPGPVWVELVVPAGERQAEVCEGLRELGAVETTTGLALVAAVGEGLARERALWARILAIAAGADVRRVTQGPLGSSIALLADEASAAGLVRALHDALLAPAAAGQAQGGRA
ncbi:MAG: aspartate kinase, partial [Acidobacteria bacterium]|nr:aspartate kinase [Acidobacteriota bacterium]